MRRHFMAWLLIAAGLALGARASAATVSPHTCASGGVDRCYTIAVADGPHAAASPPAARFEVLVAPRRRPEATDPPIFVVEALGEAGTAAAHGGLIASLEPLNLNHDLVFVDQRGVSGDLVLRCAPAASLGAAARSYYDPAALSACRDRWRGRVALAHLDAAHFAADIEAARRSLGYGRIAIIGYFYGTRIVEAYLRRFGRQVAAAALVDVMVPGVSMSRTQAGAQARALARVEQACLADRACQAQFPAFARDLAALRARLSGGPLAAGIARDGSTERVVIPADEVRDWLSALALRIGTAPAVPDAVHALAAGDDSAVAAAILGARTTVLTDLPLAEILSVRCNEDPRGAAPATPQERACDRWPRGRRLRAGALRTNVPVLAVTAADSIAAPLPAVRAFLSHLPNGRLVVLPGRARAADNDWDACLKPMIVAFFSGTPPGRIDDSCARRLPGPSFARARAS